ncbi:hypothetical protein ACFC09_37945 [Streptomyces sp. NPDC056161]|uniref:hypothetical protein n=1 Tax=Streptomyces sp. NPDC056161 TaxID=3345732 RepID=UPI0035DB1436
MKITTAVVLVGVAISGTITVVGASYVRQEKRHHDERIDVVAALDRAAREYQTAA